MGRRPIADVDGKAWEGMKLQEATSGDPMIGRALDGGKYTIQRLIGRGGQGVVYLAQQPGSEPDVVVKMLTPHRATDAEAKARFEREAAQLSSVSHPNIVSMLDYGQDNDCPYLVMEYVRGELLGEYVDRLGHLSLAQFVPIAAQILKAVGHVHSREIMVRDVKPANIMLCTSRGRDNFVKLLDFGLAKLVNEPHHITSQNVMGTVGYLSPEQIRGQALDVRVDVYSLGVLFYYMLSGRLPFEGNSLEAVLYKTSHDSPPPLEEALPPGDEVPTGLVQLIEACLSKDRRDRPDHADAIVEGLIDVVPAALFRLPKASGPSMVPPTAGLDAVGGHRPPSTHETAINSPPPVVPPSSGLVLMREPSSRPRWQLTLAAAGLLLVGGGLGSWWFGVRAQQQATDQPAAVAGVGPIDSAGRRTPDPTADPEPKTAAAGLTQTPDRSPSQRATTASESDATQTPNPSDDPRSAVQGEEPSQLSARGSVVMDSEPAASLFIDGKQVGTTPFEVDLPTGEHAIRLEARGHRPWTDNVVVEGGERLQLVVNLHTAARTKSRRSRRATRRQPTPQPPQPAAQPQTAQAETKRPSIAPGQMPRTTRRKAGRRNIDKNIWDEG